MKVTAALGAALAALALAAPGQAALTGWGLNGHGELGAGFEGKAHLPVEATPQMASAKQVVSTYFSSYALMPDGTVWAWGGNLWGQLGGGDRTTHLAPVQVRGLSGVKEIAAGGAHAIALLPAGRVATWGSDAWGVLGIGMTAHGRRHAEVLSSPVPVFPAVQGAVAVAAGGGDDAVLLGDGTVLGWGENGNGQLGDGTTEDKALPTPVAGLTGVRAIALGGVPSLGGHLLALRSDATVWAAGANGHGELGDGTTIDRHVAVRVPALAGVTALSASVDHSLALLSDGSVLAWGGDTYGQLGFKGAPLCRRARRCAVVPTRVGLSGSAIAAGQLYSLVLSGGRVLAFGNNARLQLGAEGPSRTRPVPVPGLTNVTAVSAGEYHSLALGTLG